MLERQELGRALRVAMRLKGVKQWQLAKDFGVTQPSVSEWVKDGRIAKRHLNKLVAYFLEQVQPSHWGLPNSWTPADPGSDGGEGWPFQRVERARWEALEATDRAYIEGLINQAMRDCEMKRQAMPDASKLVIANDDEMSSASRNQSSASPLGQPRRRKREARTS